MQQKNKAPQMPINDHDLKMCLLDNPFLIGSSIVIVTFAISQLEISNKNIQRINET